VHLARAYRLAGKSFAAAVHLDRALEWFEAAPESDGMTAAAVHFEKAAVEREQGRRREAISSLRQALELHQELAGRDSEVVARDYELMAVISRELGDLPQAIQCYERALYILERLVGSNEAEHAELKMTLAETQLDAGHEAVAIELMQQAAAHLECVDDERYPRALETLAAVCSLCGRYHEAIDHLRRARKAWGRVPGDHLADLASNAEALDALKKHLPPEETTPVPLEAIFKSNPPPAPEKPLAG
jgi:tetratricopeptide (TPR) repeat protein